MTSSSVSAGITPKGWQGASYPFPIMLSRPDQESDKVYQLAKSLVENFDQFQDKAIGASGWNMAAQDFSWVIPFHEGAIKYYREIGFWLDAHDAHNNNLILRQQVLRSAWEAYLAMEPDEDNFVSGWEAARAEALNIAGLQYQLN